MAQPDGTKVDVELVIALRKSKGWSQEELADETGLALRTIQGLEAGDPKSLGTLARVAKALDVPLSRLTTVTKVIIIDGNLDKMTPGNLEAIIKLATSELGLNGEVRIVMAKKGSIKLIVEMSKEDAATMDAGFRSNKLKHLGVIDFRDVKADDDIRPATGGANDHAGAVQSTIGTVPSVDGVEAALTRISSNQTREDRQNAEAWLIGVVRWQLVRAVGEMNEGIDGSSIGNVNTETLYTEIKTLLPGLGDIREPQAFYELAATAIRQWLATRLDQMIASQPAAEALARLEAWQAYHQAAGVIQEDVRIVHDLLWYAHLLPTDASEILGIPVAEVRARDTRRKQLLGSILEFARGSG